MTKLHKILFFFWCLKMRLLGLRKGTLLEVFSDEKKKPIRGVITGIVGCSVTRREYDFSFQVQFFEPTQGNDARFFNRSYFTKKQLDEKTVLV